MIIFLSKQAFLHRIRQTAEDQQCLSPEHVKVGPNLWATWDTSHYRKHLQSLWNCTMQHFYSLTPDFTPYLHPFLSPFLVLFSSSILLSSSALSFLPLHAIVFASPLCSDSVFKYWGHPGAAQRGAVCRGDQPSAWASSPAGSGTRVPSVCK